jgi:hypothetical protein
MRKNVASQVIGAQMVTAADGSAFTDAVTVYVTGDAGSQAAGSVGSGACTHEGNGYHTYAPAQAETNYDLIAFTFTGTGAVPATVQVFTIQHDPAVVAEITSARMGALTDWINGGRLDLILDAIVEDTGTTLQGELDGIQADTEDLQTQIGVAGAGLSAIPWNASWDAEVQSECTDALNAYDPPTKAELDTAVADVSVDEIQASALADLFNTDSGTTYGAAVSGSVVSEIADNAGGSALTAEDIADAVWDEAATGHTDAGKAGQQLWTDIDAILADTNELQADDTPGALAAIDAKIDTIDGIVDDILTDTGTTIPGTITTLQGNVTDILADTDELQTDWANGGRLDLIADAILADTNELQADDTPGTLSSLDTKIDTIDGIVDAILVDTGTTLDGKIDALNDISADDVWDASSTSLSISWETAVDRIYRFLMNKLNITDADGSAALRNDGDTGDIASWSITDDDTTTTRDGVTWV